MLLIVGLGMWLFGETISLKQGTGIFLGAISIYLILS
jgi:drug/metabolite transporter (DMT)-like permease